MKQYDLFSHPYEPEFKPNKDVSEEPVENPVFSDQPQRDTSAAARSS